MNTTFALSLLIVTILGFSAELAVEPDEENVVASRLLGTWIPDNALGARLGTRAGFSQVRFDRDDSVAKLVSAKHGEALRDHQVFLAGNARFEAEGMEEVWPFVLISLHGNPHLMLFQERGGDPVGDSESCNLFVVPAKEQANDLLLIGGDFNNGPFRAFRRKPELPVKDEEPRVHAHVGNGMMGGTELLLNRGDDEHVFESSPGFCWMDVVGASDGSAVFAIRYRGTPKAVRSFESIVRIEIPPASEPLSSSTHAANLGGESLASLLGETAAIAIDAASSDGQRLLLRIGYLDQERSSGFNKSYKYMPFIFDLRTERLDMVLP
jgi:hypothetical protein